MSDTKAEQTLVQPSVGMGWPRIVGVFGAERHNNLNRLSLRTPILIPGILLLAWGVSSGASGGHYACRPCPVSPEMAAGVQDQFARLSTRADTLDSTVAAFNAKCNVDNPEGSSAERACANQERELRGDLDRQDKDVAAFNQQLVSDYDSQSVVVSNRMAATAARMKAANNSSEDWQADTQEWMDMSAKARRSAQVSATLEAFGLIADAAALDAEQSLAFSEDSIGRFEKWYASYNQVLPASQRATVMTRIRLLKSRKEDAELLSLILQLVGAHISPQQAMNDDRYWEATGDVAVGTLRLAQAVMNTDPRIKLIVAAAQTGLDTSYGWTAVLLSRKRAEQLIALQDDNLKAINALSRLYIDDVKMLKQLKTARAAFTGAACSAQ